MGITSLTLLYPYRNSSNHPKVTQSVASDLAKCGIQTKLLSSTPDDFYGALIWFLLDASNRRNEENHVRAESGMTSSM